MGQASKIEWTDATWNPVRGCSMAKGSELGGCLNCYAAAQAARFAGEGGPFHLFARRTENGPRWTGRVELVQKHLTDPLHWRTPRRIFVNSMSDLLHEALLSEDIAEVFRVMHKANWHTYQLLTKRAERLLEIMPRIASTFGVMPHVWIGVSVEDQKNLDRVDFLRRTPASVRFLSLEPLLEDLDELDLTGIDWVIVGGESGLGARPLFVDWVASIVAQCRAAGVACFVKQMGAFWASDRGRPGDRKGGNWDGWPPDLRVREFPAAAMSAP